jgi:hypothetical protein
MTEANDKEIVKKEKSTSALTSGIIATIALLLPALGFRIGLIWYGIIILVCLGYGVHGLIQIKREPEKYTGKGFAIWGILFSALILLIATLVLLGVIN